MKRLITILLSFIGCVSLYGQAVPMVVAGKMHVSGPMYSVGQVNVYAKTAATVDTGKVDIVSDIAGVTASLTADTIILYSNDNSDGLLRNAATVQGATVNRKVTVRKTFTENKWTYLSLPFPVASADVTTGGKPLVGGDPSGTYWTYQFDAKLTSDSINLEAWKELTYTSGFQKGVGYMMYVANSIGVGVPGGTTVDFSTTTAGDINNLFSVANKPNPFTIYVTTVPYPNPNVGNGWAFLGGLNSTTYTYKGGYPGSTYTGTLWYRDALSSQVAGSLGHSGFRQVSLDATSGASGLAGTFIDLPPYAPFYIQDTLSTTGTGNFTFVQAGLSIASATFRSAAEGNPINDQLYFSLSSDKDQSSDQFYLNFADTYKEIYQGVEDAVKMTTFYSNSPAVWSIQDNTNSSLFINGLPMKQGREAKVGFSVPESGDYTLSLYPLQQQDVKSVILVDKVTGNKVDLLQGSYSFNSGTVNGDNDRFVLYINGSLTGTPSISSNGLYAYAKDNVLTVKNLSEGDRVQVIDLSGRTVASGKASGKEFSTALSQKGVYVVNVTGGKSSVLKVLNR